MLLASIATLTVLLGLTLAANIQLPTPSGGSAARQPDYACTNSVDWMGDAFNNEDCLAAVQALWNKDVSSYGTTEFEFLAPGATNQTQLPVMQTPLRYNSGSCTLAIAMLDTFPPGSLPGEDPTGGYNYKATDISSFEDIWLDAGGIEVNCMMQLKQPGWAPTGYSYSIGVFVWNKNSYENRNLQSSPLPPPTNSSSTQLSNELQNQDSLSASS